MRTYEPTSIGDIIDDTFGPAEFEIDRTLYHLDVEAIRARASAAVYGGDSVLGGGGSGGRDFDWVPMLVDWDDEDR